MWINPESPFNTKAIMDVFHYWVGEHTVRRKQRLNIGGWTHAARVMFSECVRFYGVR